jgi:hypothetical protein
MHSSIGKMVSPAALLLILFSLAATTEADGCIALSNNGVVGVSNEVAVIIWDKTHQTEHFIRSAFLDAKSDDAGFLVPTPTAPELAVADDRIFDLAEKYLPFPRTLAVAAAGPNSDGKEPHIVAEQDVGDYHAVILDATDATGLGDWLKKNGYPWSENSAQWLAPYLTAKWKITAFKLHRAVPGYGYIGTNAIRMSFTTDRPFFPYSEPTEASKLGGPDRVLRIALLSDERMVGKLGDGTDWPARLDLAVSSTPPSWVNVDKNNWLSYAKLSDKPDLHLPSRLTYFSDYSNPRLGKSDLYFFSSPDQSNYPH